MEHNKTSIFEEIAVEIILAYVGFYIKKFYDETLRIVFIQKIKFEKLFDYNNNLLNSMSGFHLSFYNNKLVYLNENMNNLAQFKLIKINNKKGKKRKNLFNKNNFINLFFIFTIISFII